jgi:hypothetical protein
MNPLRPRFSGHCQPASSASLGEGALGHPAAEPHGATAEGKNLETTKMSQTMGEPLSLSSHFVFQLPALI